MHTTQVAVARGVGLITASRAHKGLGPFRCPYPCSCRLHIAKPSGKENVRCVRSYFRRKNRGPCVGSGGGGGSPESERHLTCKALLKQAFGQYTFVLRKCAQCACTEYFTPCAADMRVEVECMHEALTYRYDAGVFRISDGSLILALEVYNTHATGEDKVQRSRAQGVEVAEFTCDEIESKLLGAEHMHSSLPTTLDNLQLVSFTCARCTAEERRWQQRVTEMLRIDAAARAVTAYRCARESELMREVRAIKEMDAQILCELEWREHERVREKERLEQERVREKERREQERVRARERREQERVRAREVQKELEWTRRWKVLGLERYLAKQESQRMQEEHIARTKAKNDEEALRMLIWLSHTNSQG